MRQYVEQRKGALALARRETFVPQSYDWGVEAQVDRYEAYADLDGERAGVLAAFDGQRSGLSSRLSASHTAGDSGSARVGVGNKTNSCQLSKA